ncbi:hypothetical protein B0H10DRAFT_1924182 [Mycena sp. CBHHK59/15]|nr:hypothetical protein B0H10DRAFT_1924182 [Mycena sp. CBHHK59/15]
MAPHLVIGMLALGTTALSACTTEPTENTPLNGSTFIGKQAYVGISLNPLFPATASSCCSIISSKLPGAVFYPFSEEYQQQENTYYSSEQAELQPSCRISPATADEVSLIVKIASECGCEFAVRSGGHMHWKGASNIDDLGFTMDLQKLNSISLSRDQSIVSVGPGCTWKMVYDALDPYHLVALGGRASSVGVGGFLMGDCPCRRYNLYRVPHSHPELYWAIKYGSTNFGIVTRFELLTYPLSEQVWGGALFYDISLAYPLMGTLVNFTAKLAEDPKGMSAFGIGWNPVAHDYVVCSVNIYLAPVEFPPLFSDLAVFTPISSTLRLTDLVGITDEIFGLLPGGIRVTWWTLTLKADAQILWDLHVYGAEIFRPYQDRSGFNFALNTQPVNVGIVEAGLRNGGNPFGMSQSNGDLILVLATLSWSDPEDDTILKAKFQQYSEWAETETRTRGFLTPFLYMNYASGDRDVMGSIGEDNLRRMREIRSFYDPHDIFRKYWKGGFKL